MKKLMLLALIAGASSLFANPFAAAMEQNAAAPAANAAANAAADAKADAAAAQAAPAANANPFAQHEDAWNEANAADLDAHVKAYEARSKTVRGKVANFRNAHPYAFWGILAVTGAGIVGWIVNKFFVSKKEAKSEVASATQNPALEAQQNVAAQFKPSAKKA